MKEPILHLYQPTKEIGEGKQEAHLENYKITSLNRNETKKSQCKAL